MRKSAGAGVSLTGRGLQDLSETRPDLARSRAPVCDDDLLVRESLITSPLGPATYFFEQRQRSDQYGSSCRLKRDRQTRRAAASSELEAEPEARSV